MPRTGTAGSMSNYLKGDDPQSQTAARWDDFGFARLQFAWFKRASLRAKLREKPQDATVSG